MEVQSFQYCSRCYIWGTSVESRHYFFFSYGDGSGLWATWTQWKHTRRHL